MDKNKTINEEMVEKNENKDKSIESNNNWIKSNPKTDTDSVDDTRQSTGMDGQEVLNSDNKMTTIGDNGCKVCSDEDMSTQFFASGPFYAIDADVEQMARNSSKRSEWMDRREGSDECNVLYAEMPHMFGSDINLGHNHNTGSAQNNDMSGQTAVCCGNRSSHPNGSDRHLDVDNNYQFVCYNCCSPLSVGEDSQLSHNLFYLSNNQSKSGTDGQLGEEEHRSNPSSPLKFCRESVEHIDHKSVKDESNSSDSSERSERLSNYTTVIKPKAVRPLFAPNASQMSANSGANTIGSELMRSTLPTLSFHGSTNVLTDRDESAFTQIPRRRSNSEATHHYQCIKYERNQMPSRSSIDYSRPLLTHEISSSVNKTCNRLDNSSDLSRCQAISDKQLTKNDSNNSNGVYLRRNTNNFDENRSKQRHSAQSQASEPIHMTLEEVRNIFAKNQSKRTKNAFFVHKYKRSISESYDTSVLCKSKSKSKIKCAIESLFRTKRKSNTNSPIPSAQQNPIEAESEPIDKNSTKESNESNESISSNQYFNESTSPFTHRALPPLPNNNTDSDNTDESTDKDEERQKFLDYAASIERVKDCGWYWGPISGEMAEKLLASEPCGSFIVRDSSDEHYIFSLTFKLNGLVRHVRIEHDQGNFSFGSLQKFRSNTIVDFIENAVQHSRSGRFLFFLHRRPVMGPMRVQLLHPVSRFKQIQSLQHMCRFVILKHVRRDLIEELPLPKMLKSYLNTPYYYSEELALMSKEEPNQALDQTLPPITSHSNDI